LKAILFFTREKGPKEIENFVLQRTVCIQFTGTSNTKKRFLLKAKLTNTPITWFKSCKDDNVWEPVQTAKKNRFSDLGSERKNLDRLSAILYLGHPSDYLERFTELLRLIGTRNFEDNLMLFLGPLPEVFAKDSRVGAKL
jgi:hypothetical protein